MPQRIKALDSIRGVAALIVLFWHCYKFVFPYNSVLSSSPFLQFLINFFTAGSSAVILFFILSGFVLTLSLLNNKQAYKVFIVRRFFRIYPALFVSVILSYFLHLMIGYNKLPNLAFLYANIFQPSEKIGLQNLFGHLTLAGLSIKHIFLDGVIWSLVYEARVSVIFPVLLIICCKNNYKRILPISLLLSSASTFIVWENSGTAVKGFSEATFFDSFFATIYFILFFVIGIYLALKNEAIKKTISDLSTVVKLLLLFLSIFCISYSEWRTDYYSIIVDLIHALGAAIIISFAISWREFSDFLTTKPLLWLGRISYSLYLIHWIVIYVICELFGNYLPIWVIIPAIIATSLTCAELMARFVEYPCMNFGSRLLRK